MENKISKKAKVFPKMTTVRIPPLMGRPERETCINEDDILNLNIALNTAKTIDEFLFSV